LFLISSNGQKAISEHLHVLPHTTKLLSCSIIKTKKITKLLPSGASFRSFGARVFSVFFTLWDPFPMALTFVTPNGAGQLTQMPRLANQGLSHPMARSEPAHFWNSAPWISAAMQQQFRFLFNSQW